MRKTIILLTSLFITTTAILAQNLPDKFKYQAVLRDASGEILANESATVTIALLQGTASGTSVFDESHSITTTAQGLINLNIGSINDMSVVDWSADIYFVEISVNGTVMGTSQLLSVPYALHAKTVENDEVDDADSDPTNELQDLNLNGTTLEISDGTSADLSSIQDGTGTDNQNLTGATLTGTSLEISIENGTSSTVDLATLQDGTGTDDQELTLTGITLAIENGNNVAFTGWDTDASDDFSGDYTDLTNPPIIPVNVSDLSDFDTTGATDGQILQFNGIEWTPNTTIWTKSGNNILYNTGNVGIGIATPNAKLHCFSSSGSERTLGVASTSQDGQSALLRVLALSGANPTNLLHILNISGNDLNLLKVDGPQANEFIIKNNGFVGIGTINPTAMLHSIGQGDAAAIFTSYYEPENVVKIESTGGGAENILYITGDGVATNNSLKIDGFSGGGFVVTSSNDVGVGTEFPERKLHIAGVTALMRFEDTNNNMVYDTGISTDGTAWSIYDKTHEKARLVINSATGNVGIGVTSPNAKLEVNADASNVGLIVKANASNPGNIQEWKNGSGTTLNYMPNNGGIVFENLNTPNKGIKFMADQTAGVSGAYGLFKPVANNTTSGLTIMPSGTGNASMLSIFATDALADESNSRGMFIGANDTRFFIWPRNYGTETAKPFYIYKPGNAQTAAISIGTNGNVGINTATPSAAATLDVNGSIKLNESLSIETVDKEIRFATGRIISQSVPNRLAVESFVAGQPLFLRGPGGIQFVANGERMRITDNGNIGIGTTTPEAPLHISDFMKLEPRSTAPTSPTKGMIYYDDTDDKIKVYTGSAWENLN